MLPFWNQVVEPITSLLRPQVILHAGARGGGVVENLAQFAATLNADLHVASAHPHVDFAPLRATCRDRLITHKASAREVIELIPPPDLVIIDEDPNWYTIHEILSAARARAEQFNRPFPPTLVANTGFPFGRRDSYDDPQRIPPYFRQPHERAGITLGSPSLTAGFGLFADRYNATEANSPRNGVMTAIEDFCARGDAPRLTILPHFFGLTLLTPRNAAPEIEKIISDLTLHENLSLLTETLEQNRIASQTESQTRQLENAREHAHNQALQSALRDQQTEAREHAMRVKTALEAEILAQHLPQIVIMPPQRLPPAPLGRLTRITFKAERKLRHLLGVKQPEAPPLPLPHPDAAAIKASPIFNEAWYLAHNPDVVSLSLDAAEHFLANGAAEGRDPGPDFSTAYYLNHAPDVATLGINPLLHYLAQGAREGRNPAPNFNTQYYLSQYPDVVAAGLNPLEHYIASGRAELRRAIPPSAS